MFEKGMWGAAFLMLLLFAGVQSQCSRSAGTVTVITPEPTATPEATSTAIPEPTATPQATATPLPTPIHYECCLKATRYGENYNGQPFGCYDLVRGVPVGVYSSDDPTILAAPPARYGEWPCGTEIEICSNVTCLTVWRVDSCPGCVRDHIDLSESGIETLCGYRCDLVPGGLRYRVVSYPIPSVLINCREVFAIREERCK